MRRRNPRRNGETKSRAGRVAEPDAIRGVLHAIEALEDPALVFLWNARAGVAYPDQRATAGGGFGFGSDSPARWRVLDRIVDEVHDHPPHQCFVGGDGDLTEWRELEGDVLGLGNRGHGVDAVSHELLGEEGLRIELLFGGVAAGEQEQVGHDERQATRLAVNDLQRCAILLGGALCRQRELAFPDHDRDRRAQLVRGIGGESATLRKGLFHAVEQRVEGLRQTGELVGGTGDGQAFVQIAGGDPCGLGAHRVHRPETGRGEQVTAERREQQRERKPHQHRFTHPLQHPLVRLDGLTHGHHEHPPPRAHRHRHDAFAIRRERHDVGVHVGERTHSGRAGVLPAGQPAEDAGGA